ncbi:hypothetical protein SKA58_13573 [Sphingomonas sp. SKA58]|nr:hypothetical protein SKA58_13573 [Sphingomonas sp. SKA58]
MIVHGLPFGPVDRRSAAAYFPVMSLPKQPHP